MANIENFENYENIFPRTILMAQIAGISIGGFKQLVFSEKGKIVRELVDRYILENRIISKGSVLFLSDVTLQALKNDFATACSDAGIIQVVPEG